MEELEHYLGIRPCDCLRPYCQFFGGGFGEYGMSFSRTDIEQELDALANAEETVIKVREHLKSLLTNQQ
jgi:hypothetical protein